MNTYNFSFFTTFSIIFAKKLNIKSPLLSAFVIFGLPFYFLFIIMIFLKCKLAIVQPMIYFSLLIAGFWLLLGPILIVYWELSFKKYLNELNKVIKFSTKVKRNFINRIYLNDNYRYILSLVFSFIFILVILGGVDSAMKYGLNNGLEDPVFWITLFISIQCGFTAGFGFWGIFKTINSIFIIKNHYQIEWKLFSCDKIGGLGFIYKFIMNTTYCFSAGSVVIPFWLQIASNSNLFVQFDSYFLVVIYSISIFISFLIPSRIISSIIRKKIVTKMDEISKLLNNNIDKEVKSLDFNILFSTYQYLEKYDILHLDYKKIAQFSFSFLLPLLLILIDYFSHKM